MVPTRRWWGTAALAGLLAVGAAVLDRPLVLGGTVGLGAWLVATQASFVRDASSLSRTLSVDLTVAGRRHRVDDEVELTLTVDRPTGSRRPVEVTAPLPAGVTGPGRADRTVSLRPDESTATTSFTVTPQVVGECGFEPPTVSVESALFRSRFTAAGGVSVSVEPRGPADIHVGRGGERFAAPFGEHGAGEGGGGLELSTIRRYVAGDEADRIDWNATARLGEPHVVEYESKVDIRWLLVLDRRPSMADGPPGETKLDYARQVALATLRGAQRTNDPVGLLVLGPDGVTHREKPRSDSTHYAWLRSLVGSVDPTAGATERPSRPSRRPAPRSQTDGGTVASRLRSDESTFASALGPFFEGSGATTETDADTPLHETLTEELSRLRGTVVTVVLTDDTRKRELRESLQAMQRSSDSALVFLTPTVLFESTDLDTLEDDYERYVEFEEFRRGLEGRGRHDTRIHEVGPRARVEALTESGRARRSRR